MGKKNRRSQKSDATDSADHAFNPFAGLDIPDLPKGKESIKPVVRAEPKETLRLRIEKKGRRGKTVTVIDGFEREEEAVASRLKRALGIGGSHFEGIVELQGDCREKVAGLLRDEGYTVKGI